MPATVTLRQLEIELAERYALGKVVTLTSQTTSTIVLTTEGSPELRGPFTGLGIPNGSPIIITAETTGTDVLGDRTYASGWTPSTGTVNLSPAIGGTDGTEAIIWNPEVGDADRPIEAINRALLNDVYRWELRPLTYVPDGDMQGTTVTDYWTAAVNGTASYVTAQVYPAGSAADAAGQTSLNRVVQLVSSGGSTSLDGNGIRIAPNNDMRTWYFLTAMRLVSGTGTATFSWRDNTNTAEIEVHVQRGDDDRTMTMTTLGDFLILEGTFNVPESCREIAPRLALSATGMTAQLAPVIAFPVNAARFPLPNRVLQNRVGNFFCARTGDGLPDLGLGEPLTLAGRTHSFVDYGDHLTVVFNFPVCGPIFYEEQVFGSALTLQTDTTTFPLDRVIKWAYFELTDMLMRREMMQFAKADNGTPVPSVWRPIRNQALRDAGWSSYEPPLKKVVGRR